MKLRAYCTYDGAVMAFNQPFFCRSDGEARRAFIHACTKGPLVQTALDVVLFHVGEFHDESGTLVPTREPHRLLTGLEAIAANKPENINAET